MKRPFRTHVAGSFFAVLLPPLAPAIIALLVMLSADVARAVVLYPGGIVVASENGGKVYSVDPISGAATLISSDGLLYNPMHVILDSQGRILTAERSGPGIVRVDPRTGVQTEIAWGPCSVIPRPWPSIKTTISSSAATTNSFG